MIRLLLPALFLATPLAAHEGAHVHPHSGDPVWAIALLGLVGLTAWVIHARRPR